MKPLWPLLSLLLSTTTVLAQSTTFLYVRPSGTDVLNQCTSLGNPCQTIQHAVNSVVNSGSVICIAPGTYAEDVTIARDGGPQQSQLMGCGGVVHLGALNIQANNWRVDSSVVPNKIVVAQGGGGAPATVVVQTPLSGDGLNVPIYISQPIATAIGGTGASNPGPHQIPIAEAADPFSFVTLLPDQTMVGDPAGGDPLLTTNRILPSNGQLQVRGTSAPAVTCNGGASATIKGNDSFFSITVGSGTVTSCTVTFNIPKGPGGFCDISTWNDPAIYTQVNQASIEVEQVAGATATISGSDIGCEKVTALCGALVY